MDWDLGPVAHRGLHDCAAGCIENTAGAVSAAIAAGLAVEVDLQVSADGVAMVFHDDTLDRLTGERGPVRARSAGELARIRHTVGGEPIISFTDLLDLVDGRVALFVETKSHFDGDRALEKALVGPLEAYDGPLALMSFDPDAMAWCREHIPHVPRGLVSGSYPNRAWLPEAGGLADRIRLRRLDDLERIAAAFVNYEIAALASAPPQRARREMGLPLLTWTVRTPAERSRAARLADAMVFEGFMPDPRGL
ncbi:MAG: glycerophosphodiester phosphodiesterase [Rhizobiales bacterium]|nr:glycerophosphodiester phosphodiesterase [Hyphomicrobiales bacterium]